VHKRRRDGVRYRHAPPTLQLGRPPKRCTLRTAVRKQVGAPLRTAVRKRSRCLLLPGSPGRCGVQSQCEAASPRDKLRTLWQASWNGLRAAGVNCDSAPSRPVWRSARRMGRRRAAFDGTARSPFPTEPHATRETQGGRRREGLATSIRAKPGHRYTLPQPPRPSHRRWAASGQGVTRSLPTGGGDDAESSWNVRPLNGIPAVR